MSETATTDDALGPHDLIVRFCKLQAKVMGAVFNYQSANDCFCGERQSWVDRGVWVNEQTAVEWIERVVQDAIDQLHDAPSTT